MHGFYCRSCPPIGETCDWAALNSVDPNPNLLKGALVAGPGSNDDFTDNRHNPGNLVALKYNAGLTSALAG